MFLSGLLMRFGLEGHRNFVLKQMKFDLIHFVTSLSSNIPQEYFSACKCGFYFEKLSFLVLCYMYFDPFFHIKWPQEELHWGRADLLLLLLLAGCFSDFLVGLWLKASSLPSTPPSPSTLVSVFFSPLDQDGGKNNERFWSPEKTGWIWRAKQAG